MSWRYRVFRSDLEDEVSYSIHAAHALRTLIGRTAKCQMTERVI